MKPKLFIIIVASLMLIIASVGHAQDKVGTSAAPFLGISVGPAASGMGGAFVAMAQDASVVYWNPGAMTRVPSSMVSFSHTNWILNTSYDWGAAILKLPYGYALGFNVAVLDYGEENVTTVDQQSGTGQRWSAQDLFAGISVARALTPNFSIGGTVKLIQQKIFNETATGYAVDLGLIYTTPFDGARLGMSISNFGSDMQMDGPDLLHAYDEDPENNGNNPTISSKLKTEKWPLPIFYRVGFAYDVVHSADFGFIVSSDAVIPSDNSSVVNVGGQISYKNMIFARMGYQSLGRPNTQEGLAFGFGLNYFVPGLGKVKIDYAFNDYNILQEIHTMGFSFMF